MKREDINYLAFEGGGGKGAAYLGAVVALEDLGILPIRPKKNVVEKSTIPYYVKEEGNQIKGIAGSSAGAITALLLSIGLRAKEIAEELKNPFQFMEFFDVPVQKDDYDRCRQQIKSIEPGAGQPYGSGIQLTHAASLGFFGNLLLEGVRNIYGTTLKKSEVGKRIAFNEAVHSCYETPVKSTSLIGGSTMYHRAQDNIFQDHIKQLLASGGIFPGLGARRFFRKIVLRHVFGFSERVSEAFATDLNKYLKIYNVTNVAGFLEDEGVEIENNLMFQRYKEVIGEYLWKQHMASPRDFFRGLMHVDFKTLFYMTGVRLVITGCNVTYSVPRIFSVDYTPDFPVIEAVGISMNIPIVFSPVAVRTPVITQLWYERNSSVSSNTSVDWSTYNKRYRGLYVDGGTQLNYPLHLFNAPPGRPFWEYTLIENRMRTETISPNTLGFRLGIPNMNTVPFETDTDVINQLDVGAYLGNLLGSTMFFSEDGQVRSKAEYEQTISLEAGSIGTLDFGPSRTKAETPIRNAYRKTIKKLFKAPMHEANLDMVINMLPK